MSLTWGCCNTTPVVTFDKTWFTTFTAMFPTFGCLTQEQVGAYFNIATLYVANDASNPAVCILSQLLYLVTAHVAWLLSPKDANGNPTADGGGSSSSAGLVGRISQATQGSVSVTTELDVMPGSESWYAQSQYGLMAWQAMAQFRTARYTVSPTFVGGPVFPGAPWLPVNFWGPVTGLR